MIASFQLRSIEELDKFIKEFERAKKNEKGNIVQKYFNIALLKEKLRDSLQEDTDRRGAIQPETLKYIYNFSCYLAKVANLKTSQLRKFYNSIVNIKHQLDREEDKDSYVKREIIKARYLLAYATGKNTRSLRDLFEVLDPVLERIDNFQKFLVFFEALQAILAYHKYFGGTE